MFFFNLKTLTCFHRWLLLIDKLTNSLRMALSFTGVHCRKSPPKIAIRPPKGKFAFGSFRSFSLISFRNPSSAHSNAYFTDIGASSHWKASVFCRSSFAFLVSMSFGWPSKLIPSPKVLCAVRPLGKSVAAMPKNKIYISKKMLTCWSHIFHNLTVRLEKMR